MRNAHHIIAVLFVTVLVGCSTSSRDTSLGRVRIDNTPQSGACRLTVLGSFQRPHYDVKVATEDGDVLLDARVPKANCKPGVWRHFQTDVAGQSIFITINDGVFPLAVLRDTQEIVIGESNITQYSKTVGWL